MTVKEKKWKVNLHADRHPVWGLVKGGRKRSRSWNILMGTGRPPEADTSPGLLALDLIQGLL